MQVVELVVPTFCITSQNVGTLFAEKGITSVSEERVWEYDPEQEISGTEWEAYFPERW